VWASESTVHIFRNIPSRLGAIAVASILLVACSLSERELPASEGSGSSPGEAKLSGSEAKDTPLITIKGTINKNNALISATPTKPVQVCIWRRDDLPCADVGEEGVYEVKAPSKQRIALAIKGGGLWPTLRAIVTGDKDMDLGNTRVVNEKGLKSVADALGVAHDPTLGALFFSGVVDVSVKLEPASGTVFYLDQAGNLEKGARAITMRGIGGFTEVQPGEVRLRFAHPTGECGFLPDNNMGGWPDPADPGVAIVPIEPGYHTSLVTMYCGPPR